MKAITVAIALLAVSMMCETVQGQDSLNITRLSQFETGGRELVLVDDYLYVANQGDGLGIWGVNDPTNPVQFPDYPLPDLTMGVAYHDNHLYLACGDSGLVVLDATNRTDLQEVCRIATRDTAWDLVVKDSIIYLGDYLAGLRVFNASNIEDIQEIGHYDPGTAAAFISLVDNYLFVSTMFSNLRTVNISDPTDPYQISMIRSSFACRVAGNLPMIYVADGNSGVRLINLTEPALPVQVSIFQTPGFSTDVGILDGLVVIADGRMGGLRVVDFSDPDNPVTLGYYVTDWAVEELLVGEEGVIYTNGGIFRFTRPDAVEDDRLTTPASFSLSTAFPNPFNAVTSISFTLDRRAPISFSVLDAGGRVVDELMPTEVLAPGKFSASWNAISQPTGTYFIRVQSGETQLLQPVMLIR
jgi:hypothetical protein